MTLRQEGAVSWFNQKLLLKYKAYWVDILSECVFSVEQNRRRGWGKMILVVVEALPAGSKPPAAIGERISRGEIHDLGAAAPLPTSASSLDQERAGDPVESPPKLVEYIGSASTRFAEQPSPCMA